MAEQPKTQVKPSGDATSQLVQLLVKKAGLDNFRVTGNGATDIESLARLAFNSSRQAHILWEMTREFADALDAAGAALPEHFRVIVSAAILRARSNVELTRS